MSSLLHLRIAGIDITVSSPVPIERRSLAEPYRPFILAGRTPRAAEAIRVRLVVGGPPDLRGMRPVFESGESWSMCTRDDRRYIVWRHACKTEPLWVAELSETLQRATVFCGPAMLRDNAGTPAVANPVGYPLDQILLMYFLSRRHGLLLHACAAMMDGCGLVFPGRSGAGKSTLSRLLAGKRGTDLLSDDRVAVREEGGAYRLYGTPWPGEAGVARSADIPLHAVAFLRQSAEGNTLARLPAAGALERLLPVTSIPWYDRDVFPAVVDSCGALASRVPAYDFGFTPHVKAARRLRSLASALGGTGAAL
jgi:hypothetical protein